MKTVSKLEQENAGLTKTINRCEEKAGLMKKNETLREKLRSCQEKIALLSAKSDSPTTNETTTFISDQKTANPIFNHMMDQVGHAPVSFKLMLRIGP